MHHAAAMRLVEPVANFDAIAENLIDGQRAFAQPVGKRFAFQIFHHQVIDAILVANIV